MQLTHPITDWWDLPDARRPAGTSHDVKYIFRRRTSDRISDQRQADVLGVSRLLVTGINTALTASTQHHLARRRGKRDLEVHGRGKAAGVPRRPMVGLAIWRWRTDPHIRAHREGT